MKRGTIKFFLLPLCVSLLAAVLLHYAVSSYLLHHAKEDIENILLNNRGFHQYIQQEMHPAFFAAMDQGRIAKDYYDPQLLSSSYIVRTMHELCNEERDMIGLQPIYYKMAANNPRNPVNKADAAEERLIRMFNENRDLKEYEETVTLDGHEFLYYAIPFLKNEQRCLRCHGNPEDAPIGLRERYPGDGGFHEKLGEIRAIESIRVPIGNEAYWALMITGSAGAAVFALVMLFLFNTGLRQQVRTRTASLEAEMAERKTIAEQLRASEENFRDLFNHSGDAIFLLAENGDIADANEVACARYRYTKEELLSMHVSEIDSPEEAPNIPRRIERLKREGSAFFEAEHMTKEGAKIPVEVNARHLKKGEKSVFIATCRDITERKKAESDLRKSESMLKAIIDAEPECVKLLDENANLIMMNPAGLSMIQVDSLDQVKGQCVCPMILSEHIEPFMELTRRVFQGESGKLQFEMIGTKGRHLWLETHAVPFRNEKGEIVALLGVTRDITERRQAETALAEEKERLAVTLRSIGDGVIVTDMEGRITLVNWVAEQLTGWSQDETMGQPLERVFNIINESTREKGENPVARVIATGTIVGLANHTALIRKDGSEIIIADSAAPIRDRESGIIGVVLVFRDITSQYRMEQELQKMEKLESLGILAGGLAHDFNNLLTSILGNISLCKMQVGVEHGSFDRLTEAEKAAQRATDLTNQLLTFARGGAPIKKAASMFEIVKEAVHFALSGSKVKCFYSIPPALWSTEVDKGQMIQVFNNLIINSIQAMPDGGAVNIDFENLVLDEEEVPGLSGGNYVRIAFRDEGAGIPAENLDKIFEPYFTTKNTGTGLGLATVFSILQRHEGHVTVASQADAGTTFTIYIPAIKDTVIQEKKESAGVCQGKGKILVMDDDPFVRNVVKEILIALGYEIELAEDGNTAIEAYLRAVQGKTPFDLVIMDLTIPGGMGGKEAIGKLLEIDPDAKVVVSSGYSMDPVMADFRKYGFRGVITKPFDTNQISATIAKVMEG